MQLAAHIRHPGHLDHLDRIPAHLGQFYAGPSAWPDGVAAVCRRVYLGDEFCANRMPALSAMKRLTDIAATGGYALTLLTPAMSDDEIDHNAPLLDHLNRYFPGAEVVFNDWGVMVYLKANCPNLVASAGRVLDKGFKDPRLKRPAADGQAAEMAADALLEYSTFDGEPACAHLQAMGVRRLEQDLLPYRTHPDGGRHDMASSVYFPFGFVTAGRICWTATFAPQNSDHFVPAGKCSRPCRKMLLELAHPDFGFRIFQSGNAIYFLYPHERLTDLLAEAPTNNQRLVYQGLAMAVS